MFTFPLLHAAGIAGFFPSNPPQHPDVNVSVDQATLEQTPAIVINGHLLDNSPIPSRHPHQLGVYNIATEGRLLPLDDRVSIRLPAYQGALVMGTSEGFVVDGWIVGVHFETINRVEFTVLGMYRHVLQIVFLSVPHVYVDRDRFPSINYTVNGRWHWTYISVAAVEVRAKIIQGVDDNVFSWNPGCLNAHANMTVLRCTPVYIIPLIDKSRRTVVCRFFFV